MAAHLKIDFVSDVVCPWCAVGLKSLERALERIGSDVSTAIHFQPFELNPHMPAAGEDIVEHITKKYGSTPEQLAHSHEGLRQRGAALGFTFDMEKRTRIYNTFDAHRLLYWAALERRQRVLKHALLAAYFTEGRDVSDREVLVEVAALAGLDPVRARDVLDSNQYASEVRAREKLNGQHGIQAVPSVIINDKYLIQGGQPPEVFEQALRKIAAEPVGAG